MDRDDRASGCGQHAAPSLGIRDDGPGRFAGQGALGEPRPAGQRSARDRRWKESVDLGVVESSMKLVERGRGPVEPGLCGR